MYFHHYLLATQYGNINLVNIASDYGFVPEPISGMDTLCTLDGFSCDTK